MPDEMLSLRELNTFVTVAQCGGIAKAAEALGYTQPAVSLQLQRLSRRLSVKLLEREGRTLVLTASGRNVLEHALALLKNVREFEQNATAVLIEKETLVIAALEPTASVKLPGVLAKVRQRSPHADIRVHSLGGDAIANAAREGTIDAAITVPAQIAGWVYEPLFKERLVALVKSGHRLAGQRSVSLSRIAEERLLLTDETCVYRRAVERALGRSHISAIASVETSSLLTLPAAVHAGLGIAIVPKNIPGSDNSELRMIPIREPIEMIIGLLRPKAIDETSALARFMSAAHDLRQR